MNLCVLYHELILSLTRLYPFLYFGRGSSWIQEVLWLIFIYYLANFDLTYQCLLLQTCLHLVVWNSKSLDLKNLTPGLWMYTGGITNCCFWMFLYNYYSVSDINVSCFFTSILLLLFFASCLHLDFIFFNNSYVFYSWLFYKLFNTSWY